MGEKAALARVPRVSLRIIVSIFATVIPFFSVIPSSTQAAVTTSITPTPGSGNLGTTVTPTGNLYDITGGTRPGNGPNLFHSFGNFSIGAGDIANFLNTPVNGILPPTSNILGRVTGGNISNIYGTIQTTNFGNANLFLMNPAGFLFGPGATVNVGGMASFTTADYLRMSDGTTNGYFYADPAGPSLLTAAPVAAFGFLGPNAASIAIQGGTLEVPDGKTLSFIGGPRTFTTDTGVTVPAGVTMTGGSLSAPNGLIYMATVTSPGEIPVPTLSGAQLGSFGPPSSDPAVIRIRSGEFVMDHASLIATNTSDTAQPPIDVNIQGTMVVSNGSSISSTALSDGHGSDVHIVAQSLQMDGSSIMSTSMGSGQGGAVTITATDTASFINSTINTSTSPANGISQDAGPISVTAAEVSLQDSTFLAEALGDGLTAGRGGAVTLTGTGGSVTLTGSFIATDSNAGNSGAVTITATDTASFINSTINTSTSPANGISQDAGPISVTAAEVSLQDSTFLALAFGDGLTAGHGGAVTLTGTGGSVTLTGSSILTLVFGNGDGGAVTITAPIVSLEDTAVQTGVFGDQLNPIAGNGGAVTISGTSGTGSVSLTRSLIDTSTSDTMGNSGQVTITAPTVTIVGDPNFPAIDTHTSNSMQDLNAGNAGDIEIMGTNVTLTDFAKLHSYADSGGTFSRAGTIRITGLITGSENILLANGTVLQTSTTSQARAGDIELTSKHVTLTGHSRLLSDTLGAEGGGLISITGTENIAMESGSLISTSSSFTGGAQGVAGQIELNTQQLTITGGSGVRSQTFSPPVQPATGGVQPPTNGSVTVQGISSPAQSVMIDGAGSGIFTDAIGTGAGGSITLNANTVTLQNGGALSATTSGTAPTATGGAITVNANQVQLNNGGLITASTTGAGAGGAINIGAGSTFASNAGTVSSTAAQAQGGDINISAGQSVTLNNGSLITASSSGLGNAGNIVINAGQNYTSTNSAVTTQAAQASGGNITVLASDQVYLTNSQLNASVQGSSTTIGGNIVIDPQFVILQNSQILAQATQGEGGNISITTNVFLPDSGSIVSASSQSGVNGTVNVQSPISQAGGKIIPLSNQPLEASALLSQRCAALASGQYSSFVVAGRYALPTDPGGWLSSPLAAMSADAGPVARGEGLEGDTQTVSLRKVPTSGLGVPIFSTDLMAGCTS